MHPSIPPSIPRDLGAARMRSKRDDRRTQQRLRCRGVAEVVLLRINRRLPGTLLDLSVGGCCIQTDLPIPSIERPSVEVQLTVNGITLRVAGIVRNVLNDRRAGIEFTRVTPRKASQIVELVKELMERQQDCRAYL
jgi:c-di-GMP-binding flagellar brake protein YcgR